MQNLFIGLLEEIELVKIYRIGYDIYFFRNMELIKYKVWLTIIKNLTLNVRNLRNYKKGHFLSDRQTLLFLRENRVGISRFGDGELGFLSGYSFSHQKQNLGLRKKILQILKTDDHNSHLLVGLPYDILFDRYQERNTVKIGWNAAKYSLVPHIIKKETYGSAFCFRIDNVIDENKKDYVELLSSLFEGKDIIYAGGIEPIQNLIVIKYYIKTPSINAFDNYSEILNSIREKTVQLKNPLVLLSCGITATALAFDLNYMGILSYDVGFLFTRHLRKYCE